MCSPLWVEPSIGGVLSKLALLNSTMEVGSIAALEAVVEAKWLSSFLMDNGMVPLVQSAIIVIIAE